MKNRTGIMIGAVVALGSAVLLLAGVLTGRVYPCCSLAPAGSAGIELVELLSAFSVARDESAAEYIPWTTLAEAGTPVEWVTRERYGDIPPDGFFSRYSAARHGSVLITIEGKPTHEQFRETVRPAAWEISAYGSLSTVACLELRSDGFAGNEARDIERSFGPYATLVARHPDDGGEGGGTFVGRLYRIRLPNRRPGWLVESRSIGNRTWTVEWAYFPGESGRAMAQELLDHR